MTREELFKKIDFEKSWLYDCGIFGSDVDIAFHAIKNSVIEALEQEPKTGHWIIEKWNNKEHYSCSSCQHVVDYEPCYHYCPYCGARMEGGAE